MTEGDIKLKILMDPWLLVCFRESKINLKWSRRNSANTMLGLRASFKNVAKIMNRSLQMTMVLSTTLNPSMRYSKYKTISKNDVHL